MSILDAIASAGDKSAGRGRQGIAIRASVRLAGVVCYLLRHNSINSIKYQAVKFCNVLDNNVLGQFCGVATRSELAQVLYLVLTTGLYPYILWFHNEYAVAAAYAPCSAICSFINYVKQKRGGWWRFFGMNYAKNINDSAAPALMERTNRLILFGGTPLKR